MRIQERSQPDVEEGLQKTKTVCSEMTREGEGSQAGRRLSRLLCYRGEQAGVLSPDRLGKKQDDGEAFLGGVLCGVLGWLVVLVVVMAVGVVVVVAEVEEEVG